MMSIPFFGVALALLLGAGRMRSAAVLVLVLTLLATVVLFRLHAASAIPIDL